MEFIPAPGLAIAPTTTLVGQRPQGRQRLPPLDQDLIGPGITQDRVDRTVFFQGGNACPLEGVFVDAEGEIGHISLQADTQNPGSTA